MIDNRRPGSSWLLVLLVGLIAVLSITLALRWHTLVQPAGAAALPTAVVRAAVPQNVAVNGQNPVRIAQPASIADAASPPPTPALPSEAPAPPATAAATEPAPPATITPVPLAGIAVPNQPLPTLFPTQPAPAPAPVTQPANTAGSVPILMYHYIRAVDASADPMGYNLSITPGEFEQQMAWLQQQGYTGVTMAAAQACLRGEACPPHPVALTFDDGYDDAFTAALPIMQRYGMRATFYIVNTFVGQPGYMGWEQLAALRDAGMEIGAHSLSHLNLTTLDQAMANDEISRSKAELGGHLGITVTSFCYPAGFYDASIEALVQAAGYSNATTTRWDNDYSDSFALPRRRVAGGTSLDGFAAIVAGT